MIPLKDVSENYMKDVIQEELKLYYKAKCDKCGNTDIAIVFSFLEDKKGE